MSRHRDVDQRLRRSAALCLFMLGCGNTDAPLDEAGAPLDAAVSTALDAAPRARRLVNHLGWRSYPRELDPLATHQPSEIAGDGGAPRVEFDSLEVDTSRCNYALLEHEALLAIAPGTPVELNLLHYDLFAEQPAEAHLALLFGDALQWETTIPIPSSGKGIAAKFIATRGLQVGDPIRLHLHNHGFNTWLLISIEALLPL